jgi:hypothetical protein
MARDFLWRPLGKHLTSGSGCRVVEWEPSCLVKLQEVLGNPCQPPLEKMGGLTVPQKGGDLKSPFCKGGFGGIF